MNHRDLDLLSAVRSAALQMPRTAGTEGVGTIVASERLQPGQLVAFGGHGLGAARDGAWAELATVPDGALLALPRLNARDAPAIAAAVNPCRTAIAAAELVGAVAAGETVGITGAAGAIGSVASALSLRRGARQVIGVVRDSEEAERLAARVTALIAGDDTAAQIGREAGGLDLLIDTVGGESLGALATAVRAGGRIVLVGVVGGRTARFDLEALMAREVPILPLNVGRRGNSIAPARVAAAVADVVSGKLTLPHTTFPSDQLHEALRLMASSRARGRVVVSFAAIARQGTFNEV